MRNLHYSCSVGCRRRRAKDALCCSGEPGIGKSRLVVTFAEQFANEPHTSYLCGIQNTASAQLCGSGSDSWASRSSWRLSERLGLFDQQACPLYGGLGFRRGIAFDMLEWRYQRDLKLNL